MAKREWQIKFRVNDEEWAQLCRMKNMSGMTFAALIRARVFDDKKFVVQDPQMLKGIYKELNGYGNNINQIARIAKGSKHISKETIEELLLTVKDIRANIVEFIKGVDYYNGDT